MQTKYMCAFRGKPVCKNNRASTDVGMFGCAYIPDFWSIEPVADHWRGVVQEVQPR